MSPGHHTTSQFHWIVSAVVIMTLLQSPSAPVSAITHITAMSNDDTTTSPETARTKNISYFPTADINSATKTQEGHTSSAVSAPTVSAETTEKSSSEDFASSTTEDTYTIFPEPTSQIATSGSFFPEDLILRKSNLRVNFTSARSGYIRNPIRKAADNVSGTLTSSSILGPIPLFMETGRITIRVPDDHVVMVSLPEVSMSGGRRCTPWTYIEFRVNGQKVWRTCGTVHPRATRHAADDFEVHYKTRISSRQNLAGVAFKLLFSFHTLSAMPQQLSDDVWNCSVPHWPDFALHLSCNLHVQCTEGEDEERCDFHSGACGPGRVTSAAGGCYSYTVSTPALSWDEASGVCQDQGGQLVSLNTYQEWRAVSQLLSRTNFAGVFLGLSGRNPVHLYTYRDIMSWSDDCLAFFLRMDSSWSSSSNFYLLQEDFDVKLAVYRAEADDDTPFIRLIDPLKGTSTEKLKVNILCEFELSENKTSSLPNAGHHIHVSNATMASFATPMIDCPDGHKTHVFLACDVRTACWSRGYGPSYSCDAPVTPLPPSFTCGSGLEVVPFSLVCDHRPDCSDRSDEEFCVFPPCDGAGLMNCGNQQCLPSQRRCDNVEDCANGADEQWCHTSHMSLSTSLPPAAVYLDGTGTFTIVQLPPDVPSCPPDTFQCRREGYCCLPVYMICNGLYDCPDREDEVDCDSYTCPGFYRCRDSKICLHANFVCDGLRQCPLHDDEILCNASCPQQCTCFGWAFYCDREFPADDSPELRYLEAAGSGMTLTQMSNNSMLVHLGLGQCGLQQVDIPFLPNLRYLDLSDNRLTVIPGHALTQMPNLQVLVLDGNPLIPTVFVDVEELFRVPSLVDLRLSRVVMNEFESNLLLPFENVQVLNLSFSQIDVLNGLGFSSLHDLRTLDVRGCPLSRFPREMVRTLEKLDKVYADNYKLCCPATLPPAFNLARCQAPTDEISSCDALLRSDTYRVILSVFCGLSVAGNLGSFLYRVVISKVPSRLGYGVFVTHLSVSDGLMGVYLAIIGVADRVYLGTYLWEDLGWKASGTCQVAGFLSFLSSEVSALIICLITLDRVLVLRFPFSQVHFRKTSAHVACAGVWLLGLVLAGVPLLPVTSHWRFYGRNGICIPLPITRGDFPGNDYSFSVMIVFNFVLFVFIAAGQMVIYWTVKRNSMADSSSSRTSSDLVIAQRLITVAVSDFLCWFPIGVLGLLASGRTPIPGEVNVAMAILVLPLNSALNPFLYTLNMLMERRRREKEKRIQQRIMSAQQSSHTSVVTVSRNKDV